MVKDRDPIPSRDSRLEEPAFALGWLRSAAAGDGHRDDLTPGRPVEGDPVRELLLRNPHLQSVEVLVTHPKWPR
jgi:hypothetical protein